MEQQDQHTKFGRHTCHRCRRPQVTCFCSKINHIQTSFKFVILIHPHEARRAIATGRMTHLCLPNSRLIEGIDFSQNTQVNDLLNDPKNHNLVLYPGADATNLSVLATEDKQIMFPHYKTSVIYVIDGTWRTAKKILRLSENLKKIKQICFSPETPSAFKVRKQPRAHCYSTLEAVSAFLNIMNDPQHEKLLQVFDHMVNQQIEYVRNCSSPRFIP